MAKRYELPDAAWDLVADLFTEIIIEARPRSQRVKRLKQLSDLDVLICPQNVIVPHTAESVDISGFLDAIQERKNLA